jgi:WD40 repeat protein
VAVLFDVATGAEVGRLAGLPAAVEALALTPDGGTAFTIDGRVGRRTVRAWDVGSGKERGDPFTPNHGHSSASLILSGDARWLAALDADNVYVWATARLKEGPQVLPHPPGDRNEALKARFDLSADGRRLAAAYPDNRIGLWREADGRWERAATLTSDVKTQSIASYGVAFAADGRVAGLGSRSLFVWGADGKAAPTLPLKDMQQPRVFVVDAGLTWGANTTNGGGVRLLRLGGDEALELVCPGKPERLLAFSPDGTALAAVAEDGTVRLWSLPPALDPLVVEALLP